ncbi:MAG: class I SAM-dependent methyltransferase [Candidatus Cloacimonetes bacterium]|jgi:SAM-dependent methyltransferase|nr:class I SAM-dependent methyltransferase [Candidatus Cloacimonadota bacterium]NLO44710.1 class I SAM-dependent methyltransferase [Candidatus Cloacimonadota bacterium]
MNYYNRHAQQYFDKTVHADMKELYDMVLPSLPKLARILDLGCGSGRDAAFFKDLGYEVFAIEPSQGLACLAMENFGIEVWPYKMQEIKFESEFDLIWACASLIHLKFEEMPDMWQRLKRSLKPEGRIFASFKKGDFEGLREGRWYCDYTLPKLEESGFREAGLELMLISETQDRLPGREDLVWINVVLGIA